jgi:hypothetical protein
MFWIEPKDDAKDAWLLQGVRSHKRADGLKAPFAVFLMTPCTRCRGPFVSNGLVSIEADITIPIATIVGGRGSDTGSSTAAPARTCLTPKCVEIRPFTCP